MGDKSNGEDVELLRCQSLASSNNHGNTRATGCYGLCYFAMSWKNGIYLVMFDLNQWYQAHMPPRWIFDDTSRVCPFMGLYQSQSVGRTRSVQQVWIQPATLSVFHRSSTTPTEAFYYPSALSFRAMVVCPQEAESVVFLGMQSLLLQKLSQAGSQVLNHPHRFYVQVKLLSFNFLVWQFLFIRIGFSVTGHESRAHAHRDGCTSHGPNGRSIIKCWTREQLEVFPDFLYQG